MHTNVDGVIRRWWVNYTHEDINAERCKKDQYHFHLHNAKVLRAFFDSGKLISDLIPTDIYGAKTRYMTRMELAVENRDVASVKVLLLEGLDPLSDVSYKNKKRLPENAEVLTHSSYQNACIHCHFGDQYMSKVLKEMEEWIHEKKAYEHKHSALIPFVIGTASLDWPVLVSTIVAEYLVWVNDDRIAQFSEIKSWAIAALVKKTHCKINT